MKQYRKTSLKTRLILAFLVTSIIPIILLNLFSYYNTSGIVKDNVRELSHANLLQLKNNLDVWMDSYEDILFQVYMNDDIVSMVEEINRGDQDQTLLRGQLRRALRGLFYTKEYIQSIMVITESGETVFYDLLTGKATKNSWMDNFRMTQQELYDRISADNNTHFLTTDRAGVFNADTYYLFHLGHRIIDYKNVDKQLGIVIVSIDERMLQEICSNQNDENTMNFIIDREGLMVSFPDKSLIGSKVLNWTEDTERRREAYQAFVSEQGLFPEEHITVDVVYDEAFGCDIVNVSNQKNVVERLNAQMKILLLALILSVITLVALILILIRRLTGSLNRLVTIMKRAGQGEMSARVEINRRMPQEVETISRQFNSMLARVENSMEREKEAGLKQKNAEIAALEAQINPHFLYNTLDTINWMAIDHDEFEISNSITSLAGILRYGIDHSNEAVSVRQECDWLKKYLFLQQTRLKNTFECEIHVEPEVLDYSIHKLLLQPFVENAILHGFEGKPGIHRLVVEMREEDGFLHILIRDNGKGIPEAMVEQMNRGVFPESSEKRHIGMENAITRIQMYYGALAEIKISSGEGEFTEIMIRIPCREGDCHEICDY